MSEQAQGDEARNGLSDEERRDVEERKSGSSLVIHEVIREEGEEELGRPALSLLLSALVGGVGMNASVLSKVYLRVGLPDLPWRHLVESIGYTTGFLIVVMGRMQLFTESTVTAVLPLAMKPGLKQLVALLRLWALVLIANLAGTLMVAWVLQGDALLDATQHAALRDISRELLRHDALHTLWLGIPSGYLVGCVAWLLPNNRDAAFWVVFPLTYLIGLGGFSHVVVGSTEAWTLWLSGEIGFGQAIGQFVLPSLAGNILGGTLLFAVLAHGQVRGELGQN